MKHSFIHFFLYFDNTKNMNLYILLSVAIFLLILTFVIKIEINFSFNVLNNIGTIKIKIFNFITIFKSNISIIDDYLSFTTKESKVIKIKLDINDINIQFFNELSAYIRQKIYTTYIGTQLHLSLENQMLGSIISSAINIIMSAYFYKYKLEHKDVKIQNSVLTGFRHNIIEFKIKFTFMVTIFDLIWSLIKASIVVRRGNEKEKNAICSGE